MSTTFVHFKLSYRAKTHRFIPNICDKARLLATIKMRVAQVVKDKTPAEESTKWKNYSIFWNVNNECFPLETVDDLVFAIRFSKAKPTMPPCVYLVVKPKGPRAEHFPEPSPDSGIEQTTPGCESNRLSVIVRSCISYEKEEEKLGWLMLENSGNDCFLNAAIQYMRRATDLGDALVKREAPKELTEKAEKKERVIDMLLEFLMSKGGRMHPREFRRALPTVIRDLERMFLYTQQDSYEILNKIFDDVIPEGSERKEAGPIYYEHIERYNQIVDLESILSHDWTAEDGESDLLRHCSECCPCCTANEEGHDEEKCEECRTDKQHYVVEKRHTFKGSSNYALVAFNILHPDQRMDWALAANCSMDGMKLMDRYWRAVSVIKHSGRVYNGYSRGHYVAYTRDQAGQWWLHDDDATPSSIGDKYRPNCGISYAEDVTDMQGVVAILFEKMTF